MNKHELNQFCLICIAINFIITIEYDKRDDNMYDKSVLIYKKKNLKKQIQLIRLLTMDGKI